MPERPLLVVTHVPWEGPHRLLDAFDGVPRLHSRPLEGDALPDPDALRGAVVMGGPMSVSDTDQHPALADEIDWIRTAIGAELSLLGICLGAQLLARALGADVRPAEAPEIGWGPVEILATDDPLVGSLVPVAPVLHWHGEVFDLPDGAEALARSERTEVQAFRHDQSWGLLFHAEADIELTEAWLAEPTMRAQARSALGDVHAQALRTGARAASATLPLRRARMFAAWAQLCAQRARRDAPSDQS